MKPWLAIRAMHGRSGIAAWMAPTVHWCLRACADGYGGACNPKGWELYCEESWNTLVSDATEHPGLPFILTIFFRLSRVKNKSSFSRPRIKIEFAIPMKGQWRLGSVRRATF